MSCKSNVVVNRGLSFYDEWQWFQDDGMTIPVDITGWRFFSWVKDKEGNKVFEFIITIIDALSGVIACQASKDATRLCYEDIYYSDLVCYDADNKIVGVYPYEVVMNQPITGVAL